MCDAKIQTAAAREYFVGNTLLHRIRILRRGGELFGKSNVHLHGAAGAYGVLFRKKRLSQRYRRNEVFVDVAELLFSSRRINPIAVSTSVGGFQRQDAVDDDQRHMGVLGAAVNLGPGDGAETGYHRVDLKSRLLLDHGYHRANVFA